MRVLIFALLIFASFGSHASDRDYTEMNKRASDAMLPKIKKAFVEGVKVPIERVDISVGYDCGGSVYYVFEAKPEFRNVGSHWIVEMYKANGKVHIESGI